MVEGGREVRSEHKSFGILLAVESQQEDDVYVNGIECKKFLAEEGRSKEGVS